MKELKATEEVLRGKALFGMQHATEIMTSSWGLINQRLEAYCRQGCRHFRWAEWDAELKKVYELSNYLPPEQAIDCNVGEFHNICQVKCEKYEKW